MSHVYLLHYAPDNASLPVRMVLEELGVRYETRLVDRSHGAQKSAAYRAVNPAGLIPALETPDGIIFETAAILLWLADRHDDLAPDIRNPARGDLLKWLFFASNTLHPELRRLFYADQYAGPDPAVQAHVRGLSRLAIIRHLKLLDDARPPDAPLSILDYYVTAMLRWCALYPHDSDRSWFDLPSFPVLQSVAASIETRASARAAQVAEGLGPTPFTAPRVPQPPEGSAL